MPMQPDAPRTAAPKHYLEQELDLLFKEDERMWHFVQHGSLDGVWYWDLEDPTVEWISPEFWHLLGIDPATKEHCPSAWQELIFPEDLEIALRNFDAHCADPSLPYDQIVRYRHADGSTVWVRCRGVAIRHGAGKPLRMLGTHNDLTAAKQAEEAALIKKRELERANHDLRAFAYGISHDLKAPANTAKMLLREIRESGDQKMNDEQNELFGYAQGTLDRMCELIENVLEYARLVGAPRDVVRIDPNALLSNVLSDLRARIVETGAKIDVGELPPLSGDPIQLRSLFQNLIENAIKFRSEGRPPRVSVVGRVEENKVHIEIADNGIGIEPKFHKRIFEMFSRLHNHDDYGGSGLGLAACAKVVANHAGHISVSSNPEEGSVFRVTLPMEEQA